MLEVGPFDLSSSSYNHEDLHSLWSYRMPMVAILFVFVFIFIYIIYAFIIIIILSFEYLSYAYNRAPFSFYIFNLN